MGAFASGFFQSVGKAAQDAATRKRDADSKQKDAQAQVYWDAIKSGNLSPDQVSYAQGQLQKLYGGSKPIKELFEKFGHVVGMAHRATGQGGDAAGGPQQGQPPAQMTPPPPTDGPAAAPGASAAAPAPAAAAAGGMTPPPQGAAAAAAPARMTPPPSFATMASAAYPSEESKYERATQMEIGRQRTETDERKRIAKEVGNLPEGSPEWKEYVYGIKPSTLTAPKTLDEAWLKSFQDENGREPTPAEIEGHYEAVRTKPIDQLIADGIAASKAGDQDAARQKFDLASKAAGAKKGPPSGQSVLGVIAKANAGDPDAQKQLKTYVAMQNDLAKTRGLAFGMGRAMYQIGAYYDDQGNLVPLTNFDAANAIKAGRQLTPAGHLSPQNAIAVQQFASEMDSVMKGTPAGPGQPGIPPLRENLQAFDNAGDRAIFARVMAAAGAPTYGNESSWLGNVLNQVATDELSPDGKKLVVSLRRLNETVGRMRSVLGLPSTDNAMSMTLALVPGPQTPDSAFAGMILDNLEQMGKQAIGIPTYRGLTPPAKITPPPTTGAPKVGTVEGGYRFKGGDPAVQGNWEKVKPKAAAAAAAN